MTPREAIDTMFGHVQQFAPAGIVILWPDKPGELPDEKYVRPVIRHGGGGQTSLAGADATRKFTKTGVLSIDCYAPVGDGNVEIVELYHAFTKGFESLRSSPVWYRNIRAIDRDKEGSSSRVSVLIDFQYDEHN